MPVPPCPPAADRTNECSSDRSASPERDRTCARRSIRSPSASTTPVATARPNRDSHAAWPGSVFLICPAALPSAMRAPTAFESFSWKTSRPSSIKSSRIATRTVFSVFPGAKVRVPDTAV